MNNDFTPMQLNNRELDRFKRYKELLDFCHGRHWPGHTSRGDKQLTFNYAKTIIDKVSSYVMSGVHHTVVPLEDSDGARQKAKEAENALQQVYQENNLRQLDLDTEIDCAILGDACYKGIWDNEAKNVRITAPDIRGIYAWWPGDDASRVWRVASKYNLTAEEAEIQHGVKAKGKTAGMVTSQRGSSPE